MVPKKRFLQCCIYRTLSFKQKYLPEIKINVQKNRKKKNYYIKSAVKKQIEIKT